MKLIGCLRVTILCTLGWCASLGADEEKTPEEQLREILEDLEREAGSLQPEASRKQKSYRFENSARSPEGKQVLERSLKSDPSLLGGAGHVDLIHAFDASAKPMSHRNSRRTPSDGAYSDHALVGATNSIMMWGPYTELDPGRHLVVYRFKFVDEFRDQSACFIDVSHSAVTFSSRRLAAKDLRQDVWYEVGIPVHAPEKMKFEFRFWGHNNPVALDRVYVYRLENEKHQNVSVMGAVKRTGTYRKQHREQTVARFVDAAAGNNGLAAPEAFRLYRREGEEIQRVELDARATRKKTQVKSGDIIWIPEKR